MSASLINADAVNQKLEEDLKATRIEYARKFEKRLDAVQNKLERHLKRNLFTAAVAAISLAGAIVVGAAFTANRQVNESVISLQKDVLSAQTVIRESTKELQDADTKIREAESKLKVSTDELNAKKAEYESLINDLKQRSR